jgi:hypothetical protein
MDIETHPQRDAGGRWLPGVSGNPSGRPRHDWWYSHRTHDLDTACDPSRDKADRLAAIGQLIAYLLETKAQLSTE